ncbi:response regulator transcription factor [Siphonobacter sp. SORGH_AS_1065]|uniref:response regulator transcription factor n=1 Tax=Siphonobacter sp. SORGH_AS_1065 TaxID=3041795 RepID=UPI00278717CB|nr:response regulator transcription factor [Siphonobacter sp. SORGH_AS_1065]MDQ1090076.1 DNA-binding response OmpR family regulator [Siphonobacter sp. SORGH_AS_1065]
MSIRVLIVEDDIDLGNLLRQYLELNGFTALRVFNGIEARQELLTTAYDILIIDVMMPEEDGFTLAEKLRSLHPHLPFLFVTARKAKEDVLKGLRLGADDYIVKPFDADELIQRIRNILKRTKGKEEPANQVLQIGQYHFDISNLSLASSQSHRILTEKEAQLLHYLATHPNRLVKRNDILDQLWQNADFFNGRSMDVFISRLRKYLSEDPSIHIESIRGVGFKLIME